MSVILKKDQKVGNVIAGLGEGFTEENFISSFKEMYPKDWNRIEKTYQHHLRKAKPGQKIPMPNPRQYLVNALKVWQGKFEKT